MKGRTKHSIRCVVCGTSFLSYVQLAKYCSKKCIVESAKKRYTPTTWWKKEKKCSVCNRLFFPNSHNSKHCSKECRERCRELYRINGHYKPRFEVLERDGFSCKYCGASPAKNKSVKLHVDHIIPKHKGGTDNKENLVTACEYCNLGKGQRFYPKIFTWDYE